MRKKFGNGGNGLTKAQKTLPPELKKKILMSKGKKKKSNMYASGVCSGKITPGGKKGSRKKAGNGGLMAGMTRKRRASCA